MIPLLEYIVFPLIILIVLAMCFVRGTIWIWGKLADGWYGWNRRQRATYCSAGLLAIGFPYLLWKAYELHYTLSRVPDPLSVSWIEYRKEEMWGIGGPGDNETGLMIFRLTGSSADWARRMDDNLGQALASRTEGEWLPTPVDDRIDDGYAWHADETKHTPHGPDIREYLNRYGFGIAVDRVRVEEFNQAIRLPGSVYSYGRGGRITVVDPRQGKVFVAYSG